MDIKDYKFEIGDEVITTEGEVGKIISICDCDECKSRGFYEPFWVAEDSEWSRCISKFTAEDGFYGFYKIGKYRFNNFDKNSVLSAIDDCEKRLKQLKKQLRFIKDLESSCKSSATKTTGCADQSGLASAT